MWSSGVFGSITGKGFDLGIIDDPIKSHEEAASARHQEKIFAWYRSVFYTRREPGASIVIIMTRWSDNDLVGRLLEEEKDKTSVEGWHIIHLPAIKDFNKPKFPITCTVEKDDRNSGEALCSHRYDKDELLKIRNSIGEYFFSSLYQGKPIPKSGFKFKTKWFNILPEDTPRVIQAPRIRYWDMAATQDGGTATAGVLMAKIAGKIIIEDVISGHWSVENRNKMILETAEKDYSFYQGKVSIHFEQEPGSSGKEAAQSMRRLLGKFRAFADRPTGSKEVRAEPMISYASTHGISLMSGDWNDSYIDEMTSFPLGQLKDVVDASSGGFNKLFKRSAKAR
jgi:predicted phage terminase large subunit-like protein